MNPAEHLILQQWTDRFVESTDCFLCAPDFQEVELGSRGEVEC